MRQKHPREEGLKNLRIGPIQPRRIRLLRLLRLPRLPLAASLRQHCQLPLRKGQSLGQGLCKQRVYPLQGNFFVKTLPTRMRNGKSKGGCVWRGSAKVTNIRGRAGRHIGGILGSGLTLWGALHVPLQPARKNQAAHKPQYAAHGQLCRRRQPFGWP